MPGTRTRSTRFIRQAYEDIDAVDVLVSNAPAGWADRSFGEISWDEYRSVVDGELKAAFDVTKAVLPIMMPAGHYGA